MSFEKRRVVASPITVAMIRIPEVCRFKWALHGLSVMSAELEVDCAGDGPARLDQRPGDRAGAHFMEQQGTDDQRTGPCVLSRYGSGAAGPPAESRKTTVTTKKIAIVTGAGSGIGKSGVDGAPQEKVTPSPCAGRRAGAPRARWHSKASPSGSASDRRADRRDEPPSPWRHCSRPQKGRSAGSTCSSITPGINAPGVPIEDLTSRAWRSVMSMDLPGFLCTQEAFQADESTDSGGWTHHRQQVISAYAPRPNSAPYTATKHAITGLTRSTSWTAGTSTSPAVQSTSETPETEMTAKITCGVSQANGQRGVSRPWISTASREQSSIWPACLWRRTFCS